MYEDVCHIRQSEGGLSLRAVGDGAVGRNAELSGGEDELGIGWDGAGVHVACEWRMHVTRSHLDWRVLHAEEAPGTGHAQPSRRYWQW